MMKAIDQGKSDEDQIDELKKCPRRRFRITAFLLIFILLSLR